MSVQTGESSSTVRRPRKSRGMGMPLVIAGVVFLLLVGGVAAGFMAIGGSEPLEFPIADLQRVNELQTFNYQPKLTGAAPEGLKYKLLEAPAGAKIDADTGALSWTPAEKDGPGAFQFLIQATAGSETAKQSVKLVVNEINQPPQFATDMSTAITVVAGENQPITVTATDADLPAADLRYKLGEDAPLGFRIDMDTGVLTGDISVVDAGLDLEVPIIVYEAAKDGEETATRLKIKVTPGQHPLSKWAASLRSSGKQVSRPVHFVSETLGGAATKVTVDGEDVVFANLAEPLTAIQKQLIQQSLTTRAARNGEPAPKTYSDGAMLAMYTGDNSELQQAMQTQFGPQFEAPMEVASNIPAVPEPIPFETPVAKPELASGFTPEELETLAAAYESEKLFSTKEYKTVRSAFAKRFERMHGEELKQGFGERNDAMTEWFAENNDLKEEFYLALADRDDISSAARIFAGLQEKFPEKFSAYGNLAIAISVVWDTPRAVYDYAHHQVRAKAKMPTGLVDAEGNFKYFLDAGSVMQGRGQWLPWEFLTYVINHKTPQNERVWAVQNYLGRRTMFGQCYQDVPYDMLMLNTQSEQARLNGHTYDLPSIRQIGGVCAHQADFASRVGKSLSVPAAYVAGESNSGERHAWVMWVELKNVTAKSIVFSLESHGRYRGDQYYVGTLRDPQTGMQITDRQLELRLHTIGADPVASRHADRLMQLLPVIGGDKPLETEARFEYLTKVIELCPGCEEAWQALAAMAGDPEVRENHKRKMQQVLDQAFRTFGNFPDFTLTIFDDLIQFTDDPAAQAKLYERLVLQYTNMGRPDLGCEACLTLTDMLLKQERPLEAVNNLATMIKAFPNEGRYVPKMLDRLDAICESTPKAAPQLLTFYNQFLPSIKQMRGDRPSKYCMEMFERGIALFQRHNQPAVAQAYTAQLAQIKAGNGRRER